MKCGWQLLFTSSETLGWNSLRFSSAFNGNLKGDAARQRQSLVVDPGLTSQWKGRRKQPLPVSGAWTRWWWVGQARLWKTTSVASEEAPSASSTEGIRVWQRGGKKVAARNRDPGAGLGLSAHAALRSGQVAWTCPAKVHLLSAPIEWTLQDRPAMAASRWRSWQAVSHTSFDSNTFLNSSPNLSAFICRCIWRRRNKGGTILLSHLAPSLFRHVNLHGSHQPNVIQIKAKTMIWIISVIWWLKSFDRYYLRGSYIWVHSTQHCVWHGSSFLLLLRLLIRHWGSMWDAECKEFNIKNKKEFDSWGVRCYSPFVFD